MNNAYNAFFRREERKGKFGMFWHTQGSGKSYFMVMLARKIKHKRTGNFTFLIVKDRKDLDTQIYKNFLRTEFITDKDKVHPANSKMLRKELQNDFLDSGFAELLEEENLTDAEQRRLENHNAKELEVIKVFV